MKRFENYLSRAFVASSVYLLTIILGGFFILPGVFQVDDYSFPLIIELFLKVTSAAAALVVLSLAIIIPSLKLIPKPKQRVRSPVFTAAVTLLIGSVFIFLHALYVKLRTCHVDSSDGWYCRVDGKSHVGMLVSVFFLACLVGFIAWIGQKFAKR